MAYELIVALDVHDPEGYETYRREMAPFLARHRGAFRHDFLVGKVLKSGAGHSVNRLFVLRFDDQGDRQAFFADPGYQAVRARHFDTSVRAASVLAEYTIADAPTREP